MFPKQLSRLYQQANKENHRRHYGTDPLSGVEWTAERIKEMKSWNEKDKAWFQYICASTNIRTSENGVLYLDEMQKREAIKEADDAYAKFLATKGERTASKKDGTLRERVLTRLKEQDGYWQGFDHLADVLEEDVKAVKMVMKYLKKDGFVEVLPTFSESTGLICGSGYFLTNKK